MEAGAYRTDPLSRIVIVGGVRGISGAAEPGAKDRRLMLNRPMTQETPIRQYTGQS